MANPAEYYPYIRYLQPEEIEALIKTAECPRDKALLAVMYQCGLRRSEVSLLRRQDYNEPRAMLRVTRLKKRRGYWHELPIWGNTKRLLREYLKTRTDHLDPLFLSRKNHDALGGHAIYCIFRKIADKAGIQVDVEADGRGSRHCYPHQLRHSIATHQMNCGIPVEDIMEHLAHSNINVTLQYAKVLTPRKRHNAALMQASHCFAKY